MTDGLKMSKRKRKLVSGDDSDDDFELTPKTKRAKKAEEHECQAPELTGTCRHWPATVHVALLGHNWILDF